MRLILSLLITWNSFAGSIAGNGADDTELIHRSAWFLGSRPVSFCVETASSQVSESVIEAAVLESVEKWKTYFEATAKELDYGPDTTPSFSFLRVKCSEAHDLRVSFGTTSPEIEKAKEKFIAPVSFAERTSFDRSQGWSYGLIWIRAEALPAQPIDWSSPYALKAILLHELGHVFGNEHSTGTIMRADVARFVSDLVGRHPGLVEVDHEERLLIPSTFQRKLSTNIKTPNSQALIKSYLGRDPQGPIRVQLRQDNDLGLQITLGDSISESRFNLEFKALISSSPQSRAFIAVRGEEAIWSLRFAYSFLYSMRLPNGDSTLLFYNENQEGQSDALNFMNSDGSLERIFYYDWQSYLSEHSKNSLQ